jgi:hypothetical protein
MTCVYHGLLPCDRARQGQAFGARVIQFSSAIPIKRNAALGWAATRRQAAAMLV